MWNYKFAEVNALRKTRPGTRAVWSLAKLWGRFSSCLEKASPPLRQPVSFATVSSYQENTRKQNNKQKLAFVCLFLEYSHFYWTLIILTFLVWEFLFNDIMEWIVVPHWENSRAFCKNCDMQLEGSISCDCNFGVTSWTSLSCTSSWSWEVLSIFEAQFPFM